MVYANIHSNIIHHSLNAEIINVHRKNYWKREMTKIVEMLMYYIYNTDETWKYYAKASNKTIYMKCPFATK